MKNRIVIALSFLVYSPTFAGSIVCDDATVDYVGYHSDNRLMVKLSNMNEPVFFCNPDGEWRVSGTTYYTGPQTCKSLFSMFLTAKTSKTPIKRVHFDGDDVPAACNAWGSWKSAIVRYVLY